MSRIIASVTGDYTVTGVLAAEALRKAAAAQGDTIEVEVRTPEGVLNPLTEALIRNADTKVLAGAASDPRFADPRLATVAEILADPAAVLRGKPAAGPSRASNRIVAITSCPTGIAHTFMAAEGLQQAGLALGHEVRVETQGSVGAQTPLTPEEIAAADIVLIAADKPVDLARFNGKRVFQSGTKPAINDGKTLITRALSEATLQGGAASAGTAAAQPAQGASAYKHLMSGVSFMIPFVTAGGLLIALAFAFGGIYATDPSHAHTFAGALFEIGAKSAFTLFVPVLGGYIAYSIADRPGLAPGMIGGLLSSLLGAGFLGAIVAGFIAGYGTLYLNRLIRLPRSLEGLKPVLILPVLGTLLTGLLMVYVIGTPVADVLAFLTTFLKSMQGSSAIVLGLLLGAMMAFDMGGPVNKAAYTFSVALLSAQVYTPMAAVMAAGMTPPLGIALATRLFASRFTEVEREAGLSTGALGLAFITEGAIPFAAKDPFRVIPCTVAGSAIAGAISMSAGVQLKVPHGGIFVLPIPDAVTHLGFYVIALVAGTLVTSAMLGILKRPATLEIAA
jgi:PTS system fructose-specific IIC component